MKAAIVLLLAAVAIPASAGIYGNRAAMAAMCDTYANMAVIAAGERDKGIAYGDAMAGMQNAIAIAGRNSRMGRDDKAFYSQYVAGAVPFAYSTPTGTVSAEVGERARTACRNQFGL